MTSHGMRCATNARCLEAAGARFVATLYGSRAAYALDEAEDGWDVRRQRVEGWRLLSRQHAAPTVVAAC